MHAAARSPAARARSRTVKAERAACRGSDSADSSAAVVVAFAGLAAWFGYLVMTRLAALQVVPRGSA